MFSKSSLDEWKNKINGSRYVGPHIGPTFGAPDTMSYPIKVDYVPTMLENNQCTNHTDLIIW